MNAALPEGEGPAAVAPPATEVHQHLTRADADGVRDVALAATDADGVAPLSEHVLLHLRHGGDTSGRHVIARAEGQIVGYAHLDETDLVEGGSAEIVVAPTHRGRGIGRLLLQALLGQAQRPGRLRLWAHGERSGAAELARGEGFVETRRLVQMRRSLRTPLPPVTLPAHLRVAAFRPGQDEQAWLDLNSRAFVWHPEQGRWTLADLQAREAESWFDPEGFFLAWLGGSGDGEGAGAAADAAERLVGFHWTKLHGGYPAHESAAHSSSKAPRGEASDSDGDGDGDKDSDRDSDRDSDEGTLTMTPPSHGHDLLGEVYVVAVDPDLRGRGLARGLTLLGLHHLRARGADEVMLYVEADNEPALALYERLGFVRHDVDLMFRSPGRATIGS